MLHETVGTKCKAFLFPSCRIELDEVTGNILDLRLGTLLHALPLTCSQLGEAWGFPIILCLVFADLIE